MKSKNYFYIYYFNNKELINLYKNKEYFDLLIYFSQQKNSLEEIKYLTNKYKFNINNFNWAMGYASKNNHKDLVEYFISKGAGNSTLSNSRQLDASHPISLNFNLAIRYASENNHKELVEYLKQKQKEYNNN